MSYRCVMLIVVVTWSLMIELSRAVDTKVCAPDESALCDTAHCCGSEPINNATQLLCATTCCDLDSPSACEARRETKNCYECVNMNRQFCYVSPLWGSNTDSSRCLQEKNDISVDHCIVWKYGSAPRNFELDCALNSGSGATTIAICTLAALLVVVLAVYWFVFKK
eukprot:m.120570 g.120570  ORF g.120570 m.120570 type:complete len:166 (+) comp28813_c2_seq1:80-577(+)